MRLKVKLKGYMGNKPKKKINGTKSGKALSPYHFFHVIKIRKKITPYIFIFPATLIFMTFVIIPTVQAFRISLFQWNGISPFQTAQYVGLSNYQELISDRLFINAAKNNVIWLVMFTLLPVLLGLGIALLLELDIKVKNLLKSIIFLPTAISLVVAGIIWSFVYDPDFGVLNAILKSMELEFLARGWLGRSETALFAIIIAATWISTGMCMVILSAGLKGIPPEIMEAARADGANYWQLLRHITLPLLTRPLVIVVALMIINSLKSFDIVYAMTRGGPFYSTDVIALFMYRQAFPFLRAGYGSAVAVILFTIILLTALPYIRRITERTAEY